MRADEAQAEEAGAVSGYVEAVRLSRVADKVVIEPYTNSRDSEPFWPGGDGFPVIGYEAACRLRRRYRRLAVQDLRRRPDRLAELWAEHGSKPQEWVQIDYRGVPVMIGRMKCWQCQQLRLLVAILNYDCVSQVRTCSACLKKNAAKACAELRKRNRVAPTARACQSCGETFTPARSDARFCGATCRQRAHRDEAKR